MTDYGYFDHEADIGVIGQGACVEAAFEAAAAATFALMADPASLRSEQAVAVEFEETDIELALPTWLNRLLAEARRHGLIFREFHLSRAGDRWIGRAAGEPWREGIERGVEVKGATLTGLRVAAGPDGVEARCVVDV